MGPGIINTLVGHKADVIVLTEYRLPLGEAISSALREKGWTYQASSEPLAKTNGILVAARLPLAPTSQDHRPQVAHRWIETRLPHEELTLVGLHIPGSGDKWGKKEFWISVLDFAKSRVGQRCVLAGDFNTGLSSDAEGSPFVYSEFMTDLSDLGWVDAWRKVHGSSARDFTWYSNAGNGLRLDYAFLSPVLADCLRDARHSHAERVEGCSDHSALVVDIAV